MKPILAVIFLVTGMVRAQAPESRVNVVFTGGHETEARDHGRPDVLVAAALGVPTEVFREAFSHVTPAGPGRGGPTDEEARRNKAALMHALGPYGITNERINEVSNYYRYAHFNGQLLWRNTPVTGYATVSDGVVTGFTITNPGSGYSSAPEVSIPGRPDVKIAATLSFSTEFDKNGSVKELALVGAR